MNKSFKRPYPTQQPVPVARVVLFPLYFCKFCKFFSFPFIYPHPCLLLFILSLYPHPAIPVGPTGRKPQLHNLKTLLFPSLSEDLQEIELDLT